MKAVTTESLGFVGTGSITAAMIHGLSAGASCPSRIVVSPRNAERAAQLAEELAHVEVGTDNQAVIDSCETVVLAVRPADAEAIVSPLSFRAEQRVISLFPTHRASTVARWVSPARSILRACPLPSCAERHGPILVWSEAEERESRALLAPLGELVSASTEDELHRLWVFTGVISPIYDVFAAMSSWVAGDGEVDRALAETYVAAMGQCLCRLRMAPGGESFSELAAEARTPGGLNEQAARMVRERGAPDAFVEALEALFARFEAVIGS